MFGRKKTNKLIEDIDRYAYVINITDRSEIVIKNKGSRALICRVFDCKGGFVGETRADDRYFDIEVPIGGRVEIGV